MGQIRLTLRGIVRNMINPILRGFYCSKANLIHGCRLLLTCRLHEPADTSRPVRVARGHLQYETPMSSILFVRQEFGLKVWQPVAPTNAHLMMP